MVALARRRGFQVQNVEEGEGLDPPAAARAEEEDRKLANMLEMLSLEHGHEALQGGARRRMQLEARFETQVLENTAGSAIIPMALLVMHFLRFGQGASAVVRFRNEKRTNVSPWAAATRRTRALELVESWLAPRSAAPRAPGTAPVHGGVGAVPVRLRLQVRPPPPPRSTARTDRSVRRRRDRLAARPQRLFPRAPQAVCAAAAGNPR